MEPNEPGPSVLEYLSFEADQSLTTQETRMPSMLTPRRYGTTGTSSSSSHGNSNSNSNRSSTHMQGILWKRRDVFRNRWRPRWFVLHSDQRVLTYYLLANQDTEQVVSSGTTPTPNRRRPATSYGTPSSPSPSISIGTVPNDTGSHRKNDIQEENNRRRTFSESSNASTPTMIDCDVVPRGTIFLMGSTVEANEALTSPEEDLYALTITNHENASSCHIATRTVEARDQWIDRIRLVCQQQTRNYDGDHDRDNGAPYREPPREPSSASAASSREYSNRAPPPFSPQTPFSDRTERTKTVVSSNGILAHENSLNQQNDPLSGSLQQQNNNTDPRNDTNNSNNKNNNNTATEGLLSDTKYSWETEILILFAPLVLYKVLTMMSLLGLAALCFVVTSTMVLRWVLIQHLLTVVRLFSDNDQTNDSSRANTMSIGHGSICCRFTEDLANVCTAGSEASLSHILVWSLAKGIRQQPRLVSKKYHLLPPFYSTDIVYRDLNTSTTHNNNNTADESGGVWVSKADEKNLNEIIDSFTAPKTQQQQQSPAALLQQAIGPACRIVTTSNANQRDGSQQIQLDLNLSDCPITVFVSRTTNRKEERKPQAASISINFQSTDVNACRKFAEDFQQSIRSAGS